MILPSTQYIGKITDGSRNWGAPCGGFPLDESYPTPREVMEDMLSPMLKQNPESPEHRAAKAMVDSYIETEFSGNGTTVGVGHRQIKSFAYESTAMGAFRVVNPLPQFGRDDDIVPENMLVDSHTGEGIGYVYNDMYVRNMRILWVRAGYPKFTGLSTFMDSIADANIMAALTSPDTSLSIKIGTLIGAGVGLAISIVVLPFTLLGRVLDMVGDGGFNNAFKYCTFKPQQHLYLKAWTNILVALQTNMKLALPSDMVDLEKGVAGSNGEDMTSFFSAQLAKVRNSTLLQQQKQGNIKEVQDEFGETLFRWDANSPGGIATDPDGVSNITQQEMSALKATIPRVLYCGGDVVSILNLRNARRKRVQTSTTKSLESMVSSLRELDDKIAAEREVTDPSWISMTIDGVTNTPVYKTVSGKAQELVARLQQESQERIDAYNQSEIGQDINHAANVAMDAAEEAYDVASEAAKPFIDGMKAMWNGVLDFMSEAGDQVVSRYTGDLNFIGWRMEEGMSMSESISNSYGKPELAAKLGGAREGLGIISNMIDANTGIAPLDAISKFLGATVSSVGSQLPFGGVGSLLIKGGGRIDFPNAKWEDSSSGGNTIELSATFSTPNPTPANVFQHMYVPVAGLIALGFPRGIGKNSYTAPFAVQAFSPGLISIPLGAVTSIRLERGASEMGWTHNNLPKKIKVTLTIEDLSPMMYISMTDANLFEMLRGTTSFQDYLVTLSGASITERMHGRTNLSRRWKIATRLWSATYLNPVYWGDKVGNIGVVRKMGSLRQLREYRIGR